jgi:hypothetical protein
MHPPASSLALLVRDRRLRMVSGYSLKPENEVSEHAPADVVTRVARSGPAVAYGFRIFPETRERSE